MRFDKCPTYKNDFLWPLSPECPLSHSSSKHSHQRKHTHARGSKYTSVVALWVIISKGQQITILNIWEFYSIWEAGWRHSKRSESSSQRLLHPPLPFSYYFFSPLFDWCHVWHCWDSCNWEARGEFHLFCFTMTSKGFIHIQPFNVTIDMAFIPDDDDVVASFLHELLQSFLLVT